jgi:hypothetical protein
MQILKSAQHLAKAKALSFTAARNAQKTGKRSGWSLFRDRTVPFHVKVLALTLGAAATFLLMAVEAPLEGVLAVALPFLGVPLDFAIDGLEVFVLPVLFAVLVLPSLVMARR